MSLKLEKKIISLCETSTGQFWNCSVGDSSEPGYGVYIINSQLDGTIGGGGGEGEKGIPPEQLLQH